MNEGCVAQTAPELGAGLLQNCLRCQSVPLEHSLTLPDHNSIEHPAPAMIGDVLGVLGLISALFMAIFVAWQTFIMTLSERRREQPLIVVCETGQRGYAYMSTKDLEPRSTLSSGSRLARTFGGFRQGPPLEYVLREVDYGIMAMQVTTSADNYDLVAHPCRSDDVGGFLHDGDSTLRCKGPDISDGPWERAGAIST